MNLKDDVRMALGFMPMVVLCSASFALIYLNNFVDQFYINLNGPIASQAYTLAVPVFWMVMSLAAAFGAGSAFVVRKHWAEGDDVAANESACNAIIYCLALGLIFSTVLVSVALIVINAHINNDDVMEAFCDFILPFFILFFGIALNSILCSLMAIDGGARMSIACLAISLLLNIVLDPLFVNVFGLGVFGNGLGTAVAFTMTGFVSFLWFRGHNGRIKFSLKYFKPSINGFRKGLKTVKHYLIRVSIGHFAELIIRLNLYATYALSYGVPMLCASMSYVLCSGSQPALGPRYKELAASGDKAGAMSLFRGSTVVTFLFMMSFTILVYIFAKPIVSVFTIVPGLTESRDIIVWTLRVLCFTAPFIGLKTVCNPVFAPWGDSVVSTAVSVVACLVRMVLFLIALRIGYVEAIYFFLFERMFVGLYYLFHTRNYIRRYYSVPPLITPQN